MYTFNPGPSAVYPAVRQYLTDAFDQDWLSAGHRSEKVIGLVRQTVNDLKAKLNVPQDYTVLFTSSATECWEILAQSLTPRRSFHLHNGDFGEKWFKYAKALRPASTGQRFGLDEVPDVASLPFGPDDTDLVCITQNETSTATQLREGFILNLYNRLGGALLAVDATSSLAGLNLKYIKADIWFGSVQKCFGLPAGLGVMLLSPRAVAQAKLVNDRAHYNALPALLAQMLNYQTNYTPNVLGIYLMSRVLADREPIKSVHQHLVDRAEKLYAFFDQATPLQPFVSNPETRSTTVIGLQGDPALIEEIKAKAKEAGLQLGSGYGPLKNTTIRIANFPAVPDAAMEALVQFFAKEYPG
ncbi:aminotransferase class V-fold PLP-dependent enzyme [Hymenobacter properus]|uniref:phosphoserine transaminase n=1 Tax=Hymenobacter properus TaxID=2791026 RepID=A0A931BMH6_9BACT|nr:aminotransferase class V-fold PLP-dependent enzyme [Hymenobacter properus]MBF9144041.1 aminotransferase class V-fold PLP-dependent enzyme [Hymenobacter properus]MBR7722858.1 aminotransferase class V-fold PLP-dependent enzyme [Microvirga sp. SRT04]